MAEANSAFEKTIKMVREEDWLLVKLGEESELVWPEI